MGEREIAGQVRRALITAQHEGTASSGLVRLFQAASKTAKDVGAQTALGARGLSVVSVALDLATELSENPDWSTKKVVVFGTGAYAGATMSLLRERGCADVSVYSSSGRAAGFVATRGGIALDAETLPAAVAAADVMIGCSGADTRVEAAELARVRAASPQPLIAIDLALTHDFDPAVGGSMASNSSPWNRSAWPPRRNRLNRWPRPAALWPARPALSSRNAKPARLTPPSSPSAATP